MKKYIKNTLLAVFSLSVLAGCQKELDTFNDNPNNSTTTNPSLLLAAMEVGTFETHSSGVVRYSNIFTQHLQGTNLGQMGAIALYSVNERVTNNPWNAIYGKNLMNGHILSRDFGNDYPWYNGIGQILTAINLAYATDMWGDVPYDEAFLAAERNKTPKYNTQEEIYERLQSILDKAIANLAKSEASNVGEKKEKDLLKKADFIFHGDPVKWTKVAYVLKARYALRLTEVDGNHGLRAAQKALDDITSAGMTSNADDANTYFYGAANSSNQWYDYNSRRKNYLKMGKYFVDYLKTTDDPRLKFMVGEDTKTPVGYSGNTPEDIITVKSSYIGSRFASKNSQVGIVTYAESKFIEAEAKARLGQPAQTALKEAVTASVKSVTGKDPTAAFLTAATAAYDIKNIIQQKYIALFLTMEPYNDYRRTGYPELKPNQNADKKAIPVRLPTPSDERLYNGKATVVSNVTDKIWWDKN